MNSRVAIEAIVRPVRDSDVESLGKIHARCWHETYDQLIDAAALEKLSPRRIAELWSNISSRGSEFTQVAALVDGQIVGFAGAGPAREPNSPRQKELYFMYVLAEYHGAGIGQKLFDTVAGADQIYLWIAEDNKRALSFYERNGLKSDGAAQIHTFLGQPLPEIRLVR